MKHFILLFSVVMALASSLMPALAQLPRTMSYQGLAVDGTGNPIADGAHNLQIKLYDAVGTELFSETHTNVAFVKGVFTVIIGGSTSIPASLKFEKPYFLGVSIDGGAEMSPRTALASSPYALHSEIANVALGVDASASGVVTSLNGQSGAVTLQGAGGTTITNSGGAFTISSSGGGGTGIQGVQNSDGSLTITNPNGPTATIGIADEGVTTAKLAPNAVTSAKIGAGAVGTAQLADGAVTNAKISSTGATLNQVLASNGSGGTVWQTLSIGGGLTLPFSQTLSSASTLFALTNTGIGAAISGTASASAVGGIQGITTHATGVGVLGLTSDGGSGVTTNSGVCGSSVGGNGVAGASATGTGTRGYSATTGIGIHGTVGSGATTARAALFENTSASTTGNVLEALALGTGRAGQFKINNATSSSAALYSETNGTGKAGHFVIANSASSGFALHGVSNGNTSSLGVYGQNSGSGRGGYFEVTNSSGTGTALTGNTQGLGIAAVVSNVNASNSSNTLVVSTNGTGRGGYFQISNAANNSSAIEATTNGGGHCIYGTATANSASGIFGFHSASGIGVTGSTTDGIGTYGYSLNNIGVRGLHGATTGATAGVSGETNSTAAGTSLAGATGVYGEVSSTAPGVWSAGVRGINRGTAASGIGVVGYQAGNGYGVYGITAGTTGGVGVYAASGGGTSWALYSQGKFEVSVDNAIKPSTNTWTIASDSRLKRDIRPFTDGLNVLDQINPVRYYYNGMAGTPTDKENIGILAQDMQRVAPYTVSTSTVKLRPEDREQTEILNYNSHAITYVTINAVKELNERIKQLEAKLAQMQQLLEAKGIDTGASVTGHD